MSIRKRSERVDKNPRFTLRIDQDLKADTDVITFEYNLSLNLLYNECIQFAINNGSFMTYIEKRYGHRINPRRGHFIYVRDWKEGNR